jgi:outer membrane protein assembly factor BamB
MAKRITKILFAICIVSLLIPSCAKKYSTDDTLAPQYSPSVIMGSDNHILYGLHPVTGNKNWELSLPAATYASPLVYRGRLYIGITNIGSVLGIGTDTLYKINPQTGKIVMRMHVQAAPPFSILATPIADGKLIYIATSNDSVYAIDTGTAAVAWRMGTDGTTIISSPVIFGNQIYVATTGGHIYAFDKATGINIATGTDYWDNTGSPTLGMSFQSSPAINDSLLFIGSIDSAVYCYDLKKASPHTPGTLLWKFKTKGPVYSSPAALAGQCLVGCSDYNIYSIDEVTALERWHHTTKTDVVSSPVVSADKKLVYIGGTDHILYALNIIDGSVNWFYPTNGSIRSSPLVYNNVVYVGSYDHSFYAIDAASGNLKWVKTIEGDMECSPAVEDYSNLQHNSQISGYVNGVTNN